MIQVCINGELQDLEEGLSVSEALVVLENKIEVFAMAVNGMMLHKEEYEKYILKHNDTVEVLAPICGG